jgi:hypothetical protein
MQLQSVRRGRVAGEGHVVCDWLARGSQQRSRFRAAQYSTHLHSLTMSAVQGAAAAGETPVTPEYAELSASHINTLSTINKASHPLSINDHGI